MNILPKKITDLADQFNKLPGVGARTAERYAFSVLKSSQGYANNLAQALTDLHSGIKECPKTFVLIDSSEDVSTLYIDPKRNKKLVAVVENSLDIVSLEKTANFRGTYHVLGGALSPIDGITPDKLHLQELVDRIKEDSVEEVIIATNPSVEGESTALYVQKILTDFPELTTTRLARGLPAGVDLEYADQLTLSRALEERQAV